MIFNLRVESENDLSANLEPKFQPCFKHLVVSHIKINILWKYIFLLFSNSFCVDLTTLSLVSLNFSFFNSLSTIRFAGVEIFEGFLTSSPRQMFLSFSKMYLEKKRKSSSNFHTRQIVPQLLVVKFYKLFILVKVFFSNNFSSWFNLYKTPISLKWVPRKKFFDFSIVNLVIMINAIFHNLLDVSAKVTKLRHFLPCFNSKKWDLFMFWKTNKQTITQFC